MINQESRQGELNNSNPQAILTSQLKVQKNRRKRHFNFSCHRAYISTGKSSTPAPSTSISLKKMSQYKLSYFNARALAEPIRLVFAFKRIEFEDVRIEREDWPKLKPEPQFPWGNVPVLQDGDLLVAQSGTILRYLGRKFQLNGANEAENVKCDEIVEVVADIRQAFFKAHFEPEEARKEPLVKTLKEETFPKYLKKFEEILAANGGFIVGSQVTYADLTLASYIQIFNDIFPGTLDDYPNVKAHQDKIFGLNGVKEWVAKRPVTSV